MIMWSHDEKRELDEAYARGAVTRCPSCFALVHKYTESHYTGGMPCVLLTKYCRFCGANLKQR